MAIYHSHPGTNVEVSEQDLYTISGCRTIDSARIDGGFLDCTRTQNPMALSHDDTSQAVDSLRHCIIGNNEDVNIIGHGFDGRINTGLGELEDFSEVDKFMSFSNRLSWQDILRRLRDHKIKKLWLWACHPGSGREGADFLAMVADAVKAPVAGPTGFIYCSDQLSKIYLEKNSEWQVAQSGTPPHVKSGPTHPTDTDNRLMLFNDKPSRKVPFELAGSIKYTCNNFAYRGTKKSYLVDKKDAKELLQFISFTSLFNPGGKPAAIVTGQLEINFEYQNKEEQRELVVYNDRLIYDKRADTYYPLSARMNSIFESS
jgi:hypothetical protein